jgi:hypothetical protein
MKHPKLAQPNSVRIDIGPWTKIPNVMLDSVMPILSPNGWQVLCVVMRQTWGWVSDPAGYRQDRKKMGSHHILAIPATNWNCQRRHYSIRD